MAVKVGGTSIFGDAGELGGGGTDCRLVEKHSSVHVERQTAAHQVDNCCIEGDFLDRMAGVQRQQVHRHAATNDTFSTITRTFCFP